MSNNGNYAVVRRLLSPAKKIKGSRFVKSGRLSHDLYLMDCEAIQSDVAVVSNPDKDSISGDKVFVVSNRSEWLRVFNSWVNSYTL